jgi:hypothetical protein
MLVGRGRVSTKEENNYLKKRKVGSVEYKHHQIIPIEKKR